MGEAAPGGAAAPQKETAPPDVISSEDAIAFFLSGVRRGAQEKPGAAVTWNHRGSAMRGKPGAAVTRDHRGSAMRGNPGAGVQTARRAGQKRNVPRGGGKTGRRGTDAVFCGAGKGVPAPGGALPAGGKNKKGALGATPARRRCLTVWCYYTAFFAFVKGGEKNFSAGRALHSGDGGVSGVGMRAETPPPARKGERQQVGTGSGAEGRCRGDGGRKGRR